MTDLNKRLNPTITATITAENVVDLHDTRSFVKKMREVLKEEENKRINRKTVYDQSREEEKFRKNFDDLNVTIEFIPLEVYDDLIFWGGTIDGVVQFTYTVTPNENTSDVDFNYLEDFTVDNPDNDEIIKRVQDYYSQFYQYWRDNIFQG